MAHRLVVLWIVLVALVVGGLSLSLPASGQEETPVSNEARPADVASIDTILTALYDVISGPAGDRDWERMRTLFAPDARLIPVRVAEDGSAEARVRTLEEYIEGSNPYFQENGFYETEVARTTEAFGHLVHVFSTYESRHSPEEPPFTRGINGIQLLKDGERWWIVTIFWESERPGEPIPAKYLP